MTGSTCTHLETITGAAPSDAAGCHECLKMGGRWVHLRRCAQCGHIGCCDNSPGKHATGHFHDSAHPLIQSFEPGEDWYWCYVDDLGFELAGDTNSPSHP
ncbi:MAG TPA: UBP-type zinc finger domain-containing protein [Sporichthyaceae bacterium]